MEDDTGDPRGRAAGIGGILAREPASRKRKEIGLG
jgi:hypothetical protein